MRFDNFEIVTVLTGDDDYWYLLEGRLEKYQNFNLFYLDTEGNSTIIYGIDYTSKIIILIMSETFEELEDELRSILYKYLNNKSEFPY